MAARSPPKPGPHQSTVPDSGGSTQVRGPVALHLLAVARANPGIIIDCGELSNSGASRNPGALLDGIQCEDRDRPVFMMTGKPADISPAVERAVEDTRFAIVHVDARLTPDDLVAVACRFLWREHSVTVDAGALSELRRRVGPLSPRAAVALAKRYVEIMRRTSARERLTASIVARIAPEDAAPAGPCRFATDAAQLIEFANTIRTASPAGIKSWTPEIKLTGEWFVVVTNKLEAHPAWTGDGLDKMAKSFAVTDTAEAHGVYRMTRSSKPRVKSTTGLAVRKNP